MDKKSIIQWNCRGLKANYNEILILTTLLSPKNVFQSPRHVQKEIDLGLIKMLKIQ